MIPLLLLIIICLMVGSPWPLIIVAVLWVLLMLLDEG